MPDVIKFSCPSCDSLLTVPVQLAGVSGPCPKCGQTVTSPPPPEAVTPSFPPTFLAPPQESVAESLAHPPSSLPVFPPAPAWTSAAPPPPPVSPALFPQTPAPASDTHPLTKHPQTPSTSASPVDLPVSVPPQASPSAALDPTVPHLGGEGVTSPKSPSLSRLLNPNFNNPPPETAPFPDSNFPIQESRRRLPEPAQLNLHVGSGHPPSAPDGFSRAPLPPFPNRPSKSSNFARLFISLVMLLGALGLLAYFFETQLRQFYLQYIVPQLTVKDQTDPDLQLVADSPPSEPTAPITDLEQPQPPATPIESSQPEVILKAEPPPALEDSTMPKVGPLNLDTTVGAPQAPAAQDDPIDLSITQSPSIATPIPDAAKPAADALIAFLATESLEEKRKFILGADDPQVAKLINRYYETNAPGAIPVTAIGFIRHNPNPEVGGGMQSVFMVASPEWEHPIPVMLQETKNGIKLDWIAFTEFKDDWLLKFVETFRTDPARFHVSIRRGHYFGSDVPDLENKHCFYILPPQGHFEVAAFVPKNTPLADMLGRELPWGSRNAYVLAEIQWRDDGQFKWIELTAVPQLNWHIIIEPPPSSK